MPYVRGRSRPMLGRAHSRRRTVWARSFPSSQGVTSGSKIAIDLLLGLEAGGASTLGITVARTHLDIRVQGLTTDTNPLLDMGIIRVTSEALATQFPDPGNATQQNDDWSLLRELQPGNSINSYVEGSNLFCGFTIDLKSKRKVTQMNEKYLIVYSNTGLATLQVAHLGSTLCLLP